MSRPSFLYRFIAERHGEDLAMSMCEEFGGRTMNIPREAREENPIAQALGVAVLQTLVDELGGGKVEIPMGPAAASARLQAELEAMVARGASTREITRTLKVGRNAVYRARQRLRSRRPANVT
jgi:hypothetical protein